MDDYRVYQKALPDFPMRESTDVGTIRQGVAIPVRFLRPKLTWAITAFPRTLRYMICAGATT
jgi:hypothetical protein